MQGNDLHLGVSGEPFINNITAAVLINFFNFSSMDEGADGGSIS